MQWLKTSRTIRGGLAGVKDVARAGKGMKDQAKDDDFSLIFL